MSESTPADEATAGFQWTPDWLAAARSRPYRRRSLLVAALLAGLLLAWLHWLGLVLGGALVGLASRTLPRAVVGALVLGLLVLGTHVIASPTMGVGEFLALRPLTYVTLGLTVVGPVWGALVRAVV